MKRRVFSRTDLPVAVALMGLHRKTIATRMVMVDGPFDVITREGRLSLPSDWRGFIAVDQEAWPYPIELSEYHKSYEPVGDMRVPLR